MLAIIKFFKKTIEKGFIRHYLSPDLLFQTLVFSFFRVYSVECVHLISKNAIEKLGMPQAHWDLSAPLFSIFADSTVMEAAGLCY